MDTDRRARTRPRPEPAPWLSRLMAPYWLATYVVVAVAVLLRTWHIERPGYDVDESVYERVSSNYANTGRIAAKAEYIQDAAPLYTSHPPFPFITEGLWFKLIGSDGLIAARWLSAIASVLTILLLAGFLRRLIGNWALVACALIAFDGWITFTNRVGWLENIQFPLGVAALWFYHWVATRRPKWGWLFLAGLALAGVMVFKHVGVYFLLAAMIHRVITAKRRPRKPRPGGSWAWLVYLWRGIVTLVRPLGSPLVLAPLVLMTAYVAGMTAWAGNKYLQDSWHQIQRATGQTQSRGAVKGSSDVLGPLLNQYGIYVATVVVLAVAGILVGVRFLQASLPVVPRMWNWFTSVLLRRPFNSRWRPSMQPLHRADPMLWAWAASGYAVFGIAGLKLVHYLFMIMLPAYCYLVAELGRWVERRKEGRHSHRKGRARPVVAGVLCALLALSGTYATYARVVARQDNAVGQTITWFQNPANADPDAKVIADEFIGNQIRQPYCKINHAQLCEQLRGEPDFIVAYTTTTQKLPESQALDRMLSFDNREFRTVVVVSFTGFKETIRIYKIERKAPPG